MESSFPGVTALTAVRHGRIFVRPLHPDRGALVGVLDLPATVPMEHFAQARLNDRLWLDLERFEPVASRVHWPRQLPESDVGSLLLNVQFRAPALPDALEIGLRASVLPHEDPARRWVIAYGGLAQVTGPFAEGGLFELRPQGMQLIDPNPYRGCGLQQVLREPLWGPQGRYGLAHSLDADFYPKWVKEERARNAKRDPMFAAFLSRQAELGPELLYYTREQRDAREGRAADIVRPIVAQQRLDDMADLERAVRLRGG